MPPAFSERFRARVVDKMKERRLRQMDLEKPLGLTHSSVSRLLDGKSRRGFTQDQQYALARFFGRLEGIERPTAAWFFHYLGL